MDDESELWPVVLSIVIILIMIFAKYNKGKLIILYHLMDNTEKK